MNKPTLLFLYYHPQPQYWMDGLWAALNELEKDFVITKINIFENAPNVKERYDFTLGWGGFNSPVERLMKSASWLTKEKKGLCIAGNAFPPDGANMYDVLFYETKWYRPQISFHKNIVQAFGINSDIFFPITDMPTPIIWDYIGVGAYASWKRWEKMKDKKGTRLVIGEFQKENPNESLLIMMDLFRAGVMVADMVLPIDLANYYRWSRKLYIPASVLGGGERALWEARACGIEFEYEDDNPKLKELAEAEVKDHHWYASQLKKGILSVL